MTSDPPPPRGRPRRGRSPRRSGPKAGSEQQVVGNVSFLVPPPPAPAVGLADCLDQLQQHWREDGHLAALWQAWPRLAGAQLAPHCRPLALVGGVLTVGAPPGPWLQGLLFTRHQLLGALRGAGFSVKEVRVQQYHAVPLPPAARDVQEDVWARHPSRMDVHGQADCPSCRRPAPTGEMALWGTCSFCHRAELSLP